MAAEDLRLGGHAGLQRPLPRDRFGDLEELLLALKAERGSAGPSLIAADNIGYMSRNEPALRSRSDHSRTCWTGCTAGLETVGITSDGHVQGCLSLPPEYNEGNLRLRSLSAIWNDPAAFSYTRRFHVDRLRGGCAGCPYGVVCRGGCTSLTVAATGEPHHYPGCLWRLGAGEEGPNAVRSARTGEDPDPSFG